jgi:hypothetical protein
VDGDKEILMAAKASVLEFWNSITPNMNFWWALNSRRPISADSLARISRPVRMGGITMWQRTELYLGLCWGNPLEHQYQWAQPFSGCHRIIAAVDEPSSIKV